MYCLLVKAQHLPCTPDLCCICLQPLRSFLQSQSQRPTRWRFAAGDGERARGAAPAAGQPFAAAAPSACRMCTTTCASHRDGRSRAQPMTPAAACSLTHNKRSLLYPQLLTHRLSLPLCAQAAAAGRQRHMSQQVTCHSISHVHITLQPHK